MSPAFIEGAYTYFVNSKVTFDRFYVMKIINNDADEVRRREQKERPELKKTRYLWLRNPENLNEKQKQRFDDLSRLNLKTAQAYQMKLNFQDFWKQSNDTAEDYLERWCDWVMVSDLPPMKETVGTIKRHWDGILRWFQSGLNNGILEGINSLIQLARTRARGYRSVENFITMIYLIAGKLNLQLLT